MATAASGLGYSHEPPPAPANNPTVPAGLFAFFAFVSMLAFALSVAAILVAAARDNGRPAPGPQGPVKTVAVELGDLVVKPGRVEVPSGTRLIVQVTNNGDLAHDLKLSGEIGTDRLQPGGSASADFGVIDTEAQAWCTVPGHREAGMLLTIAVTEARATAG